MLHRAGFAERASSESPQKTFSSDHPRYHVPLPGFSQPECPVAPAKSQSRVPWTHLALPNAPDVSMDRTRTRTCEPTADESRLALVLWWGAPRGQQGFFLTGWQPHVGMRSLLIAFNLRPCGLLGPFPWTLTLLALFIYYLFTYFGYSFIVV